MAALLVTSDIHKDRCDIYKDSCETCNDSSDIYKDRSGIYEDTELVNTNSHHIKVKSEHRSWYFRLLSIRRKNLCNSMESVADLDGTDRTNTYHSWDPKKINTEQTDSDASN